MPYSAVTSSLPDPPRNRAAKCRLTALLCWRITVGVKRNLIVPEHIASVWLAYNGKEDTRKIVALRSAFEWYAILFEEPSGALVAVDFTGYGTDPANWEVQNDGIDFESVDEFKRAPLTRSFF